MNRKEYYSNLAKVYVYNPKTGHKTGGNLLFLRTFAEQAKINDVLKINNNDEFKHYCSIFFHEAHYLYFCLMILDTLDSLSFKVIDKVYKKTKFPEKIGIIEYPVITLEILY